MSRTAGSGPPRSLVELLDVRAEQGRGRFVMVDPRTGTPRTLSSAELAHASRRAAAGIVHATADAVPRPGTPVLLLCADPADFVTGFFALMRAGLVPVPVPSRPRLQPRHRKRLEALLGTVPRPLLLTTRGEADELAELTAATATTVVTLEQLAEQADGSAPGGPRAHGPTAYIQYTSGSISEPKQIAVGHAHALAQLGQAAEAFGEGADSVSVNWVPLFHDMGLVTSVLRPLWSGYTSVLIDPYAFVQAPSVWPESMSRWRATHTSAPDFGYSLCARKTADVAGLDLSALRVARSAGEPVRPSTLRAFAERFGPAGFDPGAFNPSYGMAEATLTVTASELDRPPVVGRFSRRGIRAGTARPARDDADAQQIVSCGRPLRGTALRILDPDGGQAVGEGRVGEVWIAGPQVVLADEPDTLPTGEQGRRTGDAGFLHGGELYLLGRSSERFQVGGENIYSGDVEAVASSADPRLRRGRAAAFLTDDGDRLVVAAESRLGPDADEGERTDLCRTIVRAVGRELGIAVDRVCLTGAGELPLTTSGKIKRAECGTRYGSRRLRTIHHYDRGAR